MNYYPQRAIDEHRSPTSDGVQVINSFSGGHAFLSNFFYSPVIEQGITYPTIEHYFQAQKADNTEARKRIAAAPSANQAKHLGRSVHLVPNWESIKLGVMRGGLELKFAFGTVLAALLLDTGDQLLVEGNTWNDRYWGRVNAFGENWLGHLLMARRAELRSAEPFQVQPEHK